SGLKNGWMNDYVTRASWHLHDSLPHNVFHAALQFNFDKIYIPRGYYNDSLDMNWQSDADAPFTRATSCGADDLYSIALHEVLHCMGWFSLIGFTGTDYVKHPYATITTNPHVLTGLDWA